MYLQREVGETRGSKEQLAYVKEWSVPSPSLGKRRDTWQQLKRSSNYPSTRWSQSRVRDRGSHQ